MPDIARVPVELAHASRLLNHGPTVLVASAHGGRRDVMAAAWNMPLDFSPPKVAVVIDRQTLTRELVDASGSFVLSVPAAGQVDAVVGVGHTTGRAVDKFDRFGLATAPASCVPAPLVEGCLAWLECRVLPEPHLAAVHDLFLAEVVAAWADLAAFRAGRWLADVPLERRALHHLGAGVFFTDGEVVRGRVPPA